MDPNFYRAAQSGNWEAIKNFSADFHTQRTTNGNNILHVLAQARDSSAHAVQQILARKPELALQTNKNEETPLIIASRTGHLDVLRALIDCAKGNEDGRKTSGAKRVADMLKAVSENGNTALHEAVINNHHDVVKFLVEEDPKIEYKMNKAEESPLYIAVEEGNDGIASLILSTCKIWHFRGPSQKTVLQAAAGRNSAECMKLILKEFAEITNEVDEFGWTAIHYAAKFNHVEMVKLLLSTDTSTGYFPMEIDDKRTALHIAANSGHVDVIREILLHCPDCWEMITQKCQNVLHLAVENEHKEVLEFILENSWASELINQKDDNGNTPLHLYVATNKLEGYNLVNHPRANRNAFNHKGLTPLDIITIEEGDEVSERKNSIRDELVQAGATQGLRKIIIKPEPPSIEQQENTDAIMLVATLIFTVSFAAGFTVPGGYDNEKGNEGMAILSKQGAFTAFVVSDSLAMLISAYALALLFWAKHKWSMFSLSDAILNCKFYLMLALTFLLIAFLAGLYAVLPMRAMKIYLIVIAVVFGFQIPIYLVVAFVQCIRETRDDDEDYLFPNINV